MSTYHRTTHTERDALYQPVPQAEDQAEDLQIGEDDEDVLNEARALHLWRLPSCLLVFE